MFPENVNFWVYMPGAICYSWFLRQPLKNMVILPLRLEGQEIIKRRSHSSLGRHPQEGTAPLRGWARGRGGHGHTGRVTAVTCQVPSKRGWDSAAPRSALLAFQGSPPTFSQFSKGNKKVDFTNNRCLYLFFPFISLYV